MPATTVPLLVIENGNWGTTSLRAIRGVLTSAAQVLLAGFGSVPDAAIHVAPRRPAAATLESAETAGHR